MPLQPRAANRQLFRLNAGDYARENPSGVDQRQYNLPPGTSEGGRGFDQIEPDCDDHRGRGKNQGLLGGEKAMDG